MKPDFQKFITRKHSVLTDDILISSLKNTDLTGIKEHIKNLEIINGDFFVEQNWYRGIIEKYKNKNIAFFKNFINRGCIHGEKVKNFSRSLDLEGKNIAELKKDFQQSLVLLKKLLVFLLETHPLAKIIENKVIDIVKSKNSGEQLDEIMLALSSPQKLNSPVLEVKDLEKIKKSGIRGNKLESAIKRHTEKYSFLGYREPFSGGYGEDFFLQRLKNLNLKKTAVKPAKKIGLKFNAQEKKAIELLKEFTYFRNYRTEKLYEALFYLESLWNEIGARYGLGENDFGYYQLSEIKDLFTGKIKVKKEEIKKRKSCYGFLLHENKKILITGKALEGIIAKRDKNIPKTEEIKGVVASVGKAKGIVKIILRSVEQEKINCGDVLVTTMTTPNMVPAMEKAVAFVTDEGGITCHAAIIAREMKKPCIIGTKIATKVLRDGDLVEVDADQGIVKIIKQ